MPLNFNYVDIQAINFNDVPLDKVTFNGVTVWENWIEKTGDISIPSRTGSGWGSSSWKDLGKEIIPLQVRLYFSWSGSGMSSSTSCGGYLSGALQENKQDAFDLVGSNTSSIGANGNSSENEYHDIAASLQKPIRYIKSGCGGGNSGGSVIYSSSGSITRWLERPSVPAAR